MNDRDIPKDETVPMKMPTNEEILKLYEKKTQEILFAFTDEMIGLEKEIEEAKKRKQQS